MPYDPTIYLGTAVHYVRGRPPYSAELEAYLRASSVSTERVGSSTSAVDREFLPSGSRHSSRRSSASIPIPTCSPRLRAAVGELDVRNAGWVQGLAEDLPALALGTFRVATFGQSFHWTRREEVAEHVYDLLEPGGAIVLMAPTVDGRPVPDGPGCPPIPHAAIRQIIERYLGSLHRAGAGSTSPLPDRYEDALARTRFGAPEILFAPGRPDLVQDVDGVLSNYHSMSFCAPHLFGDQLDAFDDEVRATLAAHSPSGEFWDWPGDTEILIARKPPTS